MVLFKAARSITFCWPRNATGATEQRMAAGCPSQVAAGRRGEGERCSGRHRSGREVSSQDSIFGDFSAPVRGRRERRGEGISLSRESPNL